MNPPAGYYYDENGQLQMTPETRRQQEEQARQIMAKNGGQDVTFQAPQPQMPAAPVKSPSVPPEIMKSLAFSSTITPEQVAKAKASSDAAAAGYRNSEAGVSPMSRIVSALGAALPMIFSKGVGGKYGIQGYENAQDVLVKNAAMEQKRRSEIMDTENRNYDQLLRQQQLEATNKANWENKERQHQDKMRIAEEKNRIMERNGYVIDPETGQSVKPAQIKFNQAQQDRQAEEVDFGKVKDDPSYSPEVRAFAGEQYGKGITKGSLSTLQKRQGVANATKTGEQKDRQAIDWESGQVTPSYTDSSLAYLANRTGGNVPPEVADRVRQATTKKEQSSIVQQYVKDVNDKERISNQQIAAQAKKDAQLAQAAEPQKKLWREYIDKATVDQRKDIMIAERINSLLTGKQTLVKDVAALFGNARRVQGSGVLSNQDYNLNDPTGPIQKLDRFLETLQGDTEGFLSDSQRNALLDIGQNLAAVNFQQMNSVYSGAGSEIGPGRMFQFVDRNSALSHIGAVSKPARDTLIRMGLDPDKVKKGVGYGSR